MKALVSQQKTATSPRTFIQPKLMVNAPNDVYEQEADAVADRVMRMPLVSSKVQGTQGMLASSVQRKCAHCEEEKKKPIMRKAEGGGSFETSPAFASQLSNTRGGGQAMPRETKSFMESRFGQDFSHVRLHTNSTAANMSSGIQAKAFTHGTDIYFNRGEFVPNTEGGQRLLAHELTHTIQQKTQAQQLHREIDQAAFEQCVAELGGSSGYRDGGIASPEELKQYDIECRLRQNLPAQNNEVHLPKPDEIQEPKIDKVETTAPTIVPTTPTTIFSREPGCDIEAPAIPSVPVPLPFILDNSAKLPSIETAPNLDVIPSSKAWWSDTAAETFGKALAECYATRKHIDKDVKFAELQEDFNKVVQGAFGRSAKFKSWHYLPNVLKEILTNQRQTVTTNETKKNLKLPKDQRISLDDLNQEIEKQMQQKRHDIVEEVRIQVALGTWAWMAERREKLDFDTIHMNSGKSAKLPELLSEDVIRRMVHDILVAKNKELTDKEIETAVKGAQTAKDVKAKQQKEPTTLLTDDEKATTIAKTELTKVKSNWGRELRMAMIKERTIQDSADLIVPTKSDVKGWSADTKATRIHKKVVEVLKILEHEFPQGFSAGTYQMNIEGDHASGGFEGRFRSLDMYPNGGASRIQKPFGEIGFFDKQIAFSFALAIDRAVGQKSGTYQILYNDFEVAKEVNKVVKNGSMINIDNVTSENGYATNLNWHGPLVTHFHVDFAV